MKIIAMYKDGSRWRYIGVRRARYLEREASDRRYLEWWSTHTDPSQRRRMYIKVSPTGKLFFAYKGETGSGGEGTGGESLHHFVYKSAIASLAGFDVKVNNLPGRPAIPLRVIRAETERQFQHNGQCFYADIFIEFESSPEYQLRWGHALAIEVIHTSKTPQEKRNFYEEQGITVLEVKVSDKVLWRLKRIDFTNFDDDDEQRLIDDVVRRFESQPIYAYALADSLSRSWLFYENWANELNAARFRAKVAQQNESIEDLRDALDRSAAKRQALAHEQEERDAQKERELGHARALLQDVRGDLAAAEHSVAALAQSRGWWVNAALMLGALVLVLMAYELVFGGARPLLIWLLSFV